MPALLPLGLIYFAWLIGLRIVYSLLINFAGLPAALGTTVILAAVPAAHIGYLAAKRASRALPVADLARIWAVIWGVFLALTVVLPAILYSSMPRLLSEGGGLSSLLVVALAGGLLMGLFLWIGYRTAYARD